MHNHLPSLLVSVAIAWLVAGIGGLGSASAGTFYQQLVRPDWAPPGWLFGPVWTALYTLMGIAAWQIWKEREAENRKLALGLYAAQLFVNGLWSWLFFAWQMGGPAFVDIMILNALVIATIMVFWEIRPLAALLFLPYLFWISFAAVLNFTVWQLNPGLLG